MEIKNKSLLAALSKLLKIDENGVITELSKEVNDDSMVQTFIGKHKIYTTEEEATLIKNSNKTYLENGDWEVNQLPSKVYDRVAVVALRNKEKDLAKEYNVTEWKDLKDLGAKIVEQFKGKGADETTAAKIKQLETTIATMEQEKIDAVKAIEDKYSSTIAGKDFQAVVDGTNLDVADDKKKGSIELLTAAFSAKHKVSTKEGVTLVLDAEQKPILDRLGNPAKLSDLWNSFVTASGFVIKTEATAGRGTGNSTQTITGKGLSWDEFMVAKGVKANTDESDKLYTEWKAANPQN